MKRTLRRYLSIFISLAAAAMITAGAVEVNLPVVELLGKNYYVYKAKKGDSLFGIARRYGWDDAQLQELNPSAVSPLKKGMKIYYPAPGEPKKSVKATEGPGPDGELRHNVKRGETVYAISKQYGVTVDRIYKLNPDSRNGIRAGESIIVRPASKSIPKATAKDDKSGTFYTVKSGDTLYAVANQYGVSVAALMEANPGVSEKNFKAGDNIRIPARGTGMVTTTKTVRETNLDSIEIHKVSKNETWNTIAESRGISEDVLKDANPDVAELKNKQYIAIPHIDETTSEKIVVEADPRETTEGGIEEIYRDVHKIAADDERYTVRVAVVTENSSSNKDAEFLRGFLTGIDCQKRADYRIDFKVVDGSESSDKVSAELDTFKPTVIFITNDGGVPDYLAKYAESKRTPLVNTFDVKSDDYNTNPYIIQLLTPSTLFNDNIAYEAHELYGDRTLIFVGEEDNNDLLAGALHRLWEPSRIRTMPVAGIGPDMFGDDGKYLIYGYPVKKAEVSELLKNVINAREEHPLADIDVLGRPNWIVLEDALEEQFHNASVTVPSRFYIEKNGEAYRRFLQNYKMMWNRTPVKSLPLYAAVGYDTSNYFIPELAKSKGDINTLDDSRMTVQSDFRLVRASNWAGMFNPPVYLVKFTPFNSIDKIVVDYEE